MKVIVSNIQRFCLQDGPGIRTTVFFKGCNLKCPWCSNPENISFDIQKYVENGQIKYFGYEITLDELEKEILKDKDFYDKDGGVTFSGGECLLQFKKIEPLLKKLKDKNISICVESALNVSSDFVDIALKYVDYYYIDIKILDFKTQDLIGINNKVYLRNIEKLIKNNVNIIFRMPLVKNITYTNDNIAELFAFIKKYKIKTIELFRIHNLGDNKYRLLNKKINKFEKITDEELDILKKQIASLGVDVKVIGL